MKDKSCRTTLLFAVSMNISYYCIFEYRSIDNKLLSQVFYRIMCRSGVVLCQHATQDIFRLQQTGTTNYHLNGQGKMKTSHYV